MLPRALLGTTVAFGAAVVVTGMTAYMLGNSRSAVQAAPNGADVATLLAVFSGIWQYPSRVKCASLSWHTMNGSLDKETTISTE